MSETILRQWSILRSLPVYPRKRTAREIEDRLESHGFVVSKRTIERDLEKLSGLWPVSADQSSRPSRLRKRMTRTVQAMGALYGS